MEQGEEKLFSVGELARRCGVTVRTLQFYDAEGLLSPRHYTEGGRRLYERQDIIRLQQILFLKSFGFSLDEIRDRLLNIESPGQISQLLEHQREVLVGQMGKLQEMADFLARVIVETKKTGYLSTEKLVTIMEMMKQGNPYSFILRYFNQKEMKTLVKWFDEENKPQGMAPEWQALFAEMTGLYRQKADPEGEQGQALAAKWWGQVQQFTGGDPEMLQTLMTMGADVDNWPGEAEEFKTAIKEFLGKALNKYLTGIGNLPERG